MNLFERVSKLKLLRDKASKYLVLESNLDFNEWRENVVEARLISYVKKALNCNLDSESGRAEALDSIRQYQQLKYVTKDVFSVWKFAEGEAIKKIQKLEDNDSSSQPKG